MRWGTMARSFHKRIHAAADLASSMRKEDLGKIAKLLEDGDSAGTWELGCTHAGQIWLRT